MTQGKFEKRGYRITDIVGDKKANPPKPGILPFSASYWHKGVREGRFPKGIKLSSRVTIWRAEDIEAVIASWGNGSK